MSKERLHAIDALRVFAMLSVVALHASISYMTVRMPDLLWAARDPGATPFFDWLSFWLRGLTMRIFFLVAGFFAVKLYEDLGPRGFLENRGQRILIPFLVGGAILLPLIYFVWCYGWIRTGQCDLSQVLRTKFSDGIQRNIHGPAHLWFLEFLLIYYAVFFFLRKLRPAGPSAGRRLIQTILFSPLRPFLLAVPGILILLLDVNVVINFHNTFVPSPIKLLYYSLFFWVGAELYAFRGRLREYTSFSWAYLVASVPFFVWMGELLKRHIASPLQGLEILWLAVAISVFSWLSVFAFFGIFMRTLNRDRALIRYLSGASYWIYLCHFPVVGALQILLLPYDWPAAAKFLMVLLTTFTFGFLSYEWLVRATLIGTCLSGPKSGVWVRPKPFARSAKVGLSLAVTLMIAAGGVSFQNYYNSEKERTRKIIAGYYRTYFHREPDAVGLRHWTDWALNRWGFEKVEREGFARVAQGEPT